MPMHRQIEAPQAQELQQPSCPLPRPIRIDAFEPDELRRRIKIMADLACSEIDYAFAIERRRAGS